MMHTFRCVSLLLLTGLILQSEGDQMVWKNADDETSSTTSNMAMFDVRRLGIIEVLNISGTYMKTIMLTDNFLSEIPDLSAVSNILQLLMIDDNRISSITEDRLFELLSLSANGNRLTSFPTTEGHNMSLTNLLISRNRLASFPDFGTVYGTLTYLDVSWNYITAIKRSDVESFATLLTLVLNGNPMKTLDGLAPLGSTLMYLYASEMITDSLTISSQTLSSWPNLFELRITENNFEQLPNFANMGLNGAWLSMTGSNINCNCDGAFLKYIETNYTSPLLFAPPTCKGGELDFISIELTQLICEDKSRTAAVSVLNVRNLGGPLPGIVETLDARNRLDCVERCLGKQFCHLIRVDSKSGAVKCDLTDIRQPFSGNQNDGFWYSLD